MASTDYITPETAQTLPGLLNKRVSRSPTSNAYGYYDEVKKVWQNLAWQQVLHEVTVIQSALLKENLSL